MSSQVTSRNLSSYIQRFSPATILIDHHQIVLEYEEAIGPYLTETLSEKHPLSHFLNPSLSTVFCEIFNQVVSSGEEWFTVIEDFTLSDRQVNLHLMIIPVSSDIEHAEKNTFVVVFQPVMSIDKLILQRNLTEIVNEPDEKMSATRDSWLDYNQPQGFVRLIDQTIHTVHSKYEHFKNIINNVPGAVIRYQINTDGTDEMIYFSEQAGRMWEIDVQQAMKNVHLLWKQVYPEDFPPMQESIARSAEDLSLWKHQWRIKTPSGKTKWMDSIGKPFRTDKGATYWDTIIIDITEKKKAEIELARKTYQLERTESVAQVGTWEWDAESGQIYWSEEVYRIFGMDPEVPTPTIEELLPYFLEESSQKLIQAMDQAVQYGEPFEIEAVVYPKNQPLQHCISRGVAHRDEEGQVNYLYGSFQNITNLKEAEIQLRESKEMLYNIANNISGIVLRYQLHPDGTDRLLFLSKGVEELYEIPLQEAIENVHLLWQRIHPDDLDFYTASIEKSGRDQSAWNVKHRIKLPDGRVKWIKGLGQPTKLDDGSIIWDTTNIDITAEKETSAKLEAFKNHLDLAVAVAELGVFTFNMQHDLLEVSPRVKEILGLDNKSTLASLDDLLTFIVPEEKQKARSTLESNLAGNKVYNQQFRIMRPEGETGYINISLAPEKIDGVVQQIIGIVYDISNFKKIEEDLRKARDKAQKNAQSLRLKNEELEKVNKELDHFVYSTSHNLRAPLTSILGLTALLEDDNKPHKEQQIIGYINKSIHRLDDTISEITNYSKNNRLASKLEEVNLSQLIRGILESLSYMENASKMQVEDHVPEDFILISDPFRLKIILENLISNAIKYIDLHEDRSVVEISLEDTADETLIRVRDNGIGIKPDHQEKVFNMFYRASNQSSGSGLGLYIVQEVVHKLDGTISLSSEYGTGTQFEIRLPQHK